MEMLDLVFVGFFVVVFSAKVWLISTGVLEN